ncbi:head-tail connector protein [Gordonia phage Kvothe]|uniref:Uncharacterized protein n=1 Tax=Gordonia phage Kvothe TaxID=1838071 RepID=A0A166Y767_9CAUD|nr:head-tail connector protein [Gordonia phage Kvothe]ANA86087.1 hypothetical protein PBI_KVOTHE_22 [Gordonia phage Kvothe]
MPSVDELREQVRARRQELRDATRERQELEIEKSADVQKAALERELASLETDIAYEEAAKILIERADEFNKPASDVAVGGMEPKGSPAATKPTDSTPSTDSTPAAPTVPDKTDDTDKADDTDPLASLNLPGDSSDDDDQKEGK